jgi:hypothetical protein
LAALHEDEAAVAGVDGAQVDGAQVDGAQVDGAQIDGAMVSWAAHTGVNVTVAFFSEFHQFSAEIFLFFSQPVFAVIFFSFWVTTAISHW